MGRTKLKLPGNESADARAVREALELELAELRAAYLAQGALLRSTSRRLDELFIEREERERPARRRSKGAASCG